MSTSAFFELRFLNRQPSRTVYAATTHDGYPEAVVGSVVPEWRELVETEGAEGVLFRLLDDAYGIDAAATVDREFTRYDFMYRVTVETGDDGDEWTIKSYLWDDDADEWRPLDPGASA